MKQFGWHGRAAFVVLAIFLILPDGGWHGKNEVMSSEGNPAYESRAGVESKKDLLSGLMDDGMLKLQDWDTVGCDAHL